MEVVDISDPRNFETSLNDAEKTSKSTGKPLFLLFSGFQWCGDSKRGEPIVRKALSGLSGGSILLYADAAREAYRSPDYFYKSSPMDVRCVPTLIRWQDGKVHSRLNDDECQSQTIVEEFLKQK